MCVTIGLAKLSETIIATWDVRHPTLGQRRVLAYQNVPKNESNLPNCMILPIPSRLSLGPSTIINTENDIDFLKEMAAVGVPKVRDAFARQKQNYLVEMGIYHIAILNELREDQLVVVLEQIPASKRPSMPVELLLFYKKNYPKFPIILCCFNNKDAKAASPIMIHFDPINPSEFLFPTLESHGGIPSIGKPIQYHQKILLGSEVPQVKKLNFETLAHIQSSENIKGFLPKYVTGFAVIDQYPNDDLVVYKDDLGRSEELEATFYHKEY